MTRYEATGIAEGWIETDDQEKELNAWQFLIDTGLAWKLQGATGRTAHNLIIAGICKLPKENT